MTDYSQLKNKNELFPNFQEDQARAAEVLFESLYPFINNNAIDCVVDVGCGDGEILNCLARRLKVEFAKGNSKTGDGKIRLIGYDVCGESVANAQAIPHSRPCKPPRTCKGKHNGDHCEQSIEGMISLCYEKIDDLSGLWACQACSGMAVICTGHTLPHFLEVGFGTFVKWLQWTSPKVLLVDFYHSWDKAVKDAPAEEFIEVRNHCNGKVYCLYTTTEPSGGENEVLRGIKTYPCQAPSAICGADLSFETTQWGLPAEDYINKIEAAGFLKVGQRPYETGYGRMNLFMLRRLDTGVARILNDCYQVAIAAALRTLFVDDASGNDVINGLRKHFESFYSMRVAAAILPFDPEHTFSRYCEVDITMAAPAKVLTRLQGPTDEHTMILEEPNRHQERFPNAYGLYSAILGKVSSPIVFSLDEVADHRQTQRDKDFGALERELFGGNEDKAPYFTIPVYFGTLPLFVLVVRLLGKFDVKNADPRLFLDILADTHQRVITAMDACGLDLRSGLIQQFVAAAIARLSEIEKNSDALLKCFEAAFWAHASRPWKSWLRALPTEKLTDNGIIAVHQERELLKKTLRKAVDFELNDILRRISLLLRECKFFEEEGAVKGGGKTAHDEWKASAHPKRLKELCKQDDWSNADAWQQLLHIAPSDGFSKYKFEWFLARLRGLVTLSTDGDTDANDFARLKALCCRSFENQAPGYRFGLLRLHGLLECAHNNELVNLNVGDHCVDSAGIAKKELDLISRGILASFEVPDDPSEDIAKIISVMKERLTGDFRVSSVTLSVMADDYYGTADFVVSVCFTESINEGRGGADMKRVVESIQALLDDTSSVGEFVRTNLVDKSEIVFAFQTTLSSSPVRLRVSKRVSLR